MDQASSSLSHPPLMITSASVSLLTPLSGVKRRASQDAIVESSRKRLKEDIDDRDHVDHVEALGDSTFMQELADELQCGCCAALVYKPVLVLPCQHFFCGSCCVLWIRNGGTNCPSCRSVTSLATPYRALQGTLDTFLRWAPHRARSERERQQADEIYSGNNLRIPGPREASPEPNINQNTDFAQPCPHCSPGNPYGWVCPQPIPDPNMDPDHAWLLDEGDPPGHARCGNCEIMLALRAPTTSKCDMCSVSFCGINVQGRCVAASLPAQQPHGLGDIGDLIECSFIYDCFDGNNVEVEIMLDYLTAQRLTPKHIYREIIAHTQSQPRGFRTLIGRNIFSEIHGAVDTDPDIPRSRICRLCAAEVFFAGLKDWWVRERQKGFLEPNVANRKDCPHGEACSHQKDFGHAREFNHIFMRNTNAPGSGPLPALVPLDAGSSVPNAAPETLPPALDVREDSIASAPATPDFRDAIDTFL